MSFFKVNKQSIYLTVDANPKLIRPLYLQPEGVWIRSIPGCSVVGPDGKKQNIRFFRTVDANFSNWMKDNPDPLWDRLDSNDKHNQKNERVDFPIRLIHIMPVWSYADEDLKVVKLGQQFYEEMSKYHDAGGNVTSCDWMCWADGTGRRKKYLTSRKDQSQFSVPIDPQVLQVKCQEMMKQAFEDLRPFKTEEEMIKHIMGEAQKEATAFPYGANAPQAQVPAYTPGGQSPVSLGSTPALPPPAQPQMPPNMPIWQPSVMPGVVPQTTTNQPSPNVVPQTTTNQPSPNVVPQTTTGMPMQQPQMPAMPPTSYVPNMQPGQYVPTAAQPPAQPPQQQWTPPPAQQPQMPMQQPQMPQQDKVPNAPVTSQATFAPPVQQPQMPQQPPSQQSSGNGSTVIDFGKHQGKTLAWILENDRPYLTFLKGNKKHLSDEIDRLLGAAPSQQAPAPQAGVSSVADETQRSALVQKVNDKLMMVPEFQGPSIGKVMMPWIESVIGTADFSVAPIDQLLRLDAALDQRIHGQAGA